MVVQERPIEKRQERNNNQERRDNQEGRDNQERRDNQEQVELNEQVEQHIKSGRNDTQSRTGKRCHTKSEERVRNVRIIGTRHILFSAVLIGCSLACLVLLNFLA